MPAPCSLRATLLALALSPFLLGGCGKDAPPSPGGPATAGTGATPAASKYALAAEPKTPAPISVLDAKALGEKDEVVVLGRVRELTSGFAAFTLTDVSLTYCGQTEEEGCEVPWDYCCHDSSEIAKSTIAVAVKASDGEIVAVPSLPELRNLDLVLVVGALVKGADGEATLRARGWYRRERPKLPASVRFPQ